MKEFLFGNVQIGFKSQELMYKVSRIELGTLHETQLYLFVAAPNNLFRLPTYPWRGSSHFVVLNIEI